MKASRSELLEEIDDLKTICYILAELLPDKDQETFKWMINLGMYEQVIRTLNKIEY